MQMGPPPGGPDLGDRVAEAVHLMKGPLLTSLFIIAMVAFGILASLNSNLSILAHDSRSNIPTRK